MDNFFSPLAHRLRALVNPVLCWGMKAHMQKSKRLHVLRQPKLEAGQPYIFASNHSFADDIASAIVSIDRHVYLLTNSGEQLMLNRDMYAAWLNGMIFVDTRDPQSRKQAIPKMQKVLAHGGSVLVFPEGSWNVTENKAVGRLFPGVSVLARKSGQQVVPLAQYQAPGASDIYLNFGDPLDLHLLGVEEGLALLRDQLATLRFDILEQQVQPLTRAELPRDIRARHLNNLMAEFFSLDWVDPDWEDEFQTYTEGFVRSRDVWGFVDHTALNTRNARHLAWAQHFLDEERKYDVVHQIGLAWSKRTARGQPS